MKILLENALDLLDYLGDFQDCLFVLLDSLLDTGSSRMQDSRCKHE